MWDKSKSWRIMGAAAGALAVAGVGAAVAGGTDGPDAVRAQATPLPQGSQAVQLDPANFTANVDNPYFPLVPGSRWVYRSSTPGRPVEREVARVTRTTRTIAGIQARVVRDISRDRKGRKTEDTRDWYAQDREGNVWYLGEATQAYRRGRPHSRAGSWEAGVDGAQPGIQMPAHPTAGMSYRQEYSAGRAEDNGAIVGTGDRVTVAAGGYKDVLTTRDTNALTEYDLEYKFYVRGVGMVLTLGVAGDPERADLVSYRRGG